MRIGFYTNYTPAIAEVAERIGFRSLELSAWPHSSLNPNKVTKSEISAMKKDLEARDIELSALGYYPNYLAPDAHEADEALAYLAGVIDLAGDMDVPVVATFAGRNPELSVEDNLPAFKERFSRICEHAEQRNVRIAQKIAP